MRAGKQSAYLGVPDLAELHLSPISIAIIGAGKIAQDQHLPVIAKNPQFQLAALVSQRGVTAPGAPSFRTPAELYSALPGVQAVAICTPPDVRHAIAREALDAGKHVLLEKPPARTMAEMADLAAYAAQRRLVIFATWHSQYNEAVDVAKKRLTGQKIRSLFLEWKEDVCYWHPGQDWVWEAGNFGVFDPGVNGLSIVTKIMPGACFVKSASLDFPENRDAPIAASMVLKSPSAENDAATLTAQFDWRQLGGDRCNITVETASGDKLNLTHRGTRLAINGAMSVDKPMREYEGIYAEFAGLIESGQGAMDAAPFQLVADAFLVASRRTVAPFDW